MNSRARRPGEGQLSLLELNLLPELDLLDDRDRAGLAFASDHHLQARVADRVRSVLGVHQTRHHQLLAAPAGPAGGRRRRRTGADRRAAGAAGPPAAAAPASAAASPAVSVLWWVAAANGVAAVYLAAHTVLHRPRNAPQVAAVAVALVVVGLALGWLAVRNQPPRPPAPVEQPAGTRGTLPAGPVAGT